MQRVERCKQVSPGLCGPDRSRAPHISCLRHNSRSSRSSRRIHNSRSSRSSRRSREQGPGTMPVFSCARPADPLFDALYLIATSAKYTTHDAHRPLSTTPPAHCPATKTKFPCRRPPYHNPGPCNLKWRKQSQPLLHRYGYG